MRWIGLDSGGGSLEEAEDAARLIEFDEIDRAAARIEQQINLRVAGSILEVCASNGVVAFGDTQGACNGMCMVPGDYFKRVATPGIASIA